MAAQTDDRRANDIPRGHAPEESECVTVAIDLGKYLTHWIVVAWAGDASGHIVDYGCIELPSRDLGVEQAIMIGLEQFDDIATAGWPQLSSDEAVIAVWIDAGYVPDVVYQFCRDAKQRSGYELYWPAIGRGATQQRSQWYNRPKRTGAVVKYVGEGFHVSWVSSVETMLVEVNADH